MTPITAERLKQAVHYQPETGRFVWLERRGRAVVGRDAGRIHCYGYRVISIDGIGYAAHRLAWLYVHGVLPSGVIDHINGERADNRIANLRDVDHYANAENRKGARSGKKIPLMGVHKQTLGNRFHASITVRGVVVALGGFATAEEAHAAYMTAKAERHIYAESAFTATKACA